MKQRTITTIIIATITPVARCGAQSAKAGGLAAVGRDNVVAHVARRQLRALGTCCPPCAAAAAVAAAAAGRNGGCGGCCGSCNKASNGAGENAFSIITTIATIATAAPAAESEGHASSIRGALP